MLNASLIDVPRPFIDPIDTLVEALGVLALAMPRPLVEGTLLLAMDRQRRGLGMVRSDATTSSGLHHLVGLMCRIPAVRSVVMVSLRSGDLIRPDDVDHLFSTITAMNNAGLTLCDWVVAGRGGLYCPRSLAGTANPWSSDSACR